MKYNKMKNWKSGFRRCALGLGILVSGVLVGCAGIGDVDATKNAIDDKLSNEVYNEISNDELANNVSREESAPTDIFEDKQELDGQESDKQDSEVQEPEKDNEPETDVVQPGQPGESSTEITQTEPSQIGTGESGAAAPEPELPDPELEGYPELRYDKAGWGLVYGEAGAQSRGNEKAKTLAEYNAYYIGNAEDKVIYLTFDCGYENGNTDLILNALAEHGVKATFFVTGHFLEVYPDLVKRMVNEGHAVANHSYNHPDITQFTSKEELAKELDPIKEKFNEITGTELSMYFRPPEGKCYAKAMKWSKDMGYATIFWSVAHVDWNTSNQPEPEKALETLTERIHPGAIVLLHNTSSTNGAIINELIGVWEEMGYTIAPLSDLVGY